MINPSGSKTIGLRDVRFSNFKTSIIGMPESNLHDGPIHFNCFPDFTLSLSVLHILKAIILR